MTRCAPETIETARLHLRKPQGDDADAIFTRFSSDDEVTRYVGWPKHASVADARVFIAHSDTEWEEWPAGPFLAWSRSDGRLLGATGLMFDTTFRAQTGVVFARDAWGQGYASEALGTMVAVARACGVRRLYAVCHVDHAMSAHVLEKVGFQREGVLRRYAEFPNLARGTPQDVICYAVIL